MAQNVTLVSADWQQKGISLVPASSSEFVNTAPSLTPSNAPPNISSAYPYSFILKNTTSRTIIAFGVRWTCVDGAGQSRSHDRVWSNLSNFTGGLAIASGSERLVSPVLTLGPNLESNALTKALAPFQGRQSITVSLEAVIFSDGTALGTDANNTIPRIQARIDAERVLLTELAQAWQQGGVGAMSDYLRGIVAMAPPQNGDLAVIHGSSAYTAYTAALSDARTQFARTFLQAATSNPTAFANFVQRTLATKTYPNVHR